MLQTNYNARCCQKRSVTEQEDVREETKWDQFVVFAAAHNM